MILYRSKKWLNDLDKVIENLPVLGALQKKSVFITGATGLIGSAIVYLLIRFNETHDEKIKIYASYRNIEKMTDIFGEFIDKEYFNCILYNSNKDNHFEFKADYIIHAASNAYPSKFIEEPVETMISNFSGTLNLLRYAKEVNSKRLLYVSSSEVYGQKDDSKPYSESEYGFVDILNKRNSYPVSKRAAETLCVSYSEEYGVDTVIVRPGHIYGPTASESDNRVSSSFMYLAADGSDIILKSDGLQLRSYCHCLDCASAIITVLIKGENSVAYNISNPESIITIREMAEFLAEEGGVKVIRQSASENEIKSFNPMLNSSLNSEKLIFLGWKGAFSAKSGLKDAVKVIKELGKAREFDDSKNSAPVQNES